MRQRPHRPGPSIDPDELSGYLAGVRHRISEAEPERRASLERQLRDAEVALARGDRAEAEHRLEALDDQMLGEEPELAEFPRGLVDYVPQGGRGGPAPVDEDPLPNRILLIGRLATLAEDQGQDVTAARRLLVRAEAAFASADRAAARRWADAAHAALDGGRRNDGSEP